MKGTIQLRTIRALLTEINNQCPHICEWVTIDSIWCFKTTPPTQGGLYAFITHCTVAAHSAVLMHDHVCTHIYIYIPLYPGDNTNSVEQLAEWYANDLYKYFLWTPQESTCLFTLMFSGRHASIISHSRVA